MIKAYRHPLSAALGGLLVKDRHPVRHLIPPPTSKLADPSATPAEAAETKPRTLRRILKKYLEEAASLDFGEKHVLIIRRKKKKKSPDSQRKRTLCLSDRPERSPLKFRDACPRPPHQPPSFHSSSPSIISSSARTAFNFPSKLKMQSLIRFPATHRGNNCCPTRVSGARPRAPSPCTVQVAGGLGPGE